MGAAAGPDIVEDGLVLYLDAANLKSYPGSGTTWFDLSGNGNNAILTGAYQFTNDSFHFNDGAQLDGTGRATVDFGSIGSSFPYTIECVFMINRYKFLSSQSNISAQLFSSGRAVGNFDEAFYMGRNRVSGEVQAAGLAWYDAGNADGPGGESDEIFINQIYSTTVTIDTPGNVLFYTNGLLSNTDTTTATDLKIDQEWSVANQPPGIDAGVDSNFYTIRVYNRILTPQEIKQNFNALRGRYGI